MLDHIDVPSYLFDYAVAGAMRRFARRKRLLGNIAVAVQRTEARVPAEERPAMTRMYLGDALTLAVVLDDETLARFVSSAVHRHRKVVNDLHEGFAMLDRCIDAFEKEGKQC